jgi:CheY-like chemotaxis protein
MPDHPSPPLILIVDDNPLIRLDLSGSLAEAGYRTVEAGNAHEALARLAEQEPALIVTDVYMEPGDGLELIRNVRANHPGVRIIAMSGHDRRYQVLDRAEQSGAHGALAKPIQRFELLDLVARLLPAGAAR